MSVGDPVVEDVVASLVGNFPGFSFLTAALQKMRLETLIKVAPQASVIALMADPTSPQTRGVIDDHKRGCPGHI